MLRTAGTRYRGPLSHAWASRSEARKWGSESPVRTGSGGRGCQMAIPEGPGPARTLPRNWRCPGRARAQLSPAVAKPGGEGQVLQLEGAGPQDTGGWRRGGGGAKAA